MTGAEFGEFMGAMNYVLDAFNTASHQREPGWVVRERMAVTRSANEWATSHGRPTVTVVDVERVEKRAIGHIDYASKFALYVAELLYAALGPTGQETP